VNPKVLVIDIDCTLVDTGASWNSWIAEQLQVEEKPIVEGCPYDLRDLYAEDLAERSCVDRDALMMYWSIPTLYSELEPFSGAVRALEEVAREGIHIVFASHTKKGHFSSKVKWCKEWFPFVRFGDNGGFAALQEKHYLKADWVIDDRNAVLNKFPEEVVRIRIDTPYTQDEPEWLTTRRLTGWEDGYMGWFK
jgi:5'(3')-deoxyribonucleotidase